MRVPDGAHVTRSRLRNDLVVHDDVAVGADEMVKAGR
jgi:hypothetical protein